MKMTTHLTGGIPVLDPHGKIVGPTVSELREKLALELLDAAVPRILIDFRHVHKIDSSALGMLVNMHVIAAQMNGRIDILNVGRHIRNLLVLTRFTTVFEHFEDKADAISAFTQMTPHPHRGRPYVKTPYNPPISNPPI